MTRRINAVFDVVKLIAKRMPDLGELLIQVLLIVLLVFGAGALLGWFPSN